MSAALSLPFDLIATVPVFATTQGGIKTNVLPGSTITSDNPSVVVTPINDANGNLTGYTATATAKTGSANISLSPPAGSSVPVDVAVCTITTDPVVAQVQDTAAATFAPNPNPPTT